MSHSADKITRYQQLRQISLSLNNLLTSNLTREEIDEGGLKLGIMKNGTLVFADEGELAALMDFCLHDVWRNSTNAIERFYRSSPPPAGSDEMAILEAKRQARFSIFIVEDLAPGLGLHVRDLLYDEDLFITDIAFSLTASRGSLIAFRLIRIEGFNVTTGAALPLGQVPDEGREVFMREFVAEFKKMLARRSTPQEISELTAMIISSSIARGSTTRIRYAEPGELPKRKRKRLIPHRSAPVMVAKHKKTIGREDRCPCGSGRKYKNCCLERE